MAKHSVTVVESFSVVTKLGPLVVAPMGTGPADVVDGPRDFTYKYEAGKVVTFPTKKAAASFRALHGAKVS
jgi:hypothetical protein